MNKQKAARIIFLVVLFAFLLSVMAGPAYAKEDADQTTAGDKKLSAKKGMEVLEGDPKKKEEGATKTQKIIGFGSIVVMIIVVKFF